MKTLKILGVLLLLPFTANADINIEGVDMGSLSDWYVHVDFEYMRKTESGKKRYAWMEQEVFDDLKEDAGIDVDRDLNQIIARSDGNEGVIVVMNGTVRQEHKDQIMALAATQNLDLAPRKAGRREYYWMEGDSNDEPFEDGAFFSFDVKDKFILTSSEDAIKELLGNGGRVATKGKNTMLMFSAKNPGVGGASNGNVEWDSNIMQNTEEAMLSIADDNGKVRVKAELVATEAEMADSLASIVRGLISLQVFNDEIEPELADVLKSTSVEVNDRTLSIGLSVDSDTVVEAMGD